MLRRLVSILVVLALGCGDGSDPPRAGMDAPVPSPGSASDPRAEPQGPVVVFLGTSLTAGLGLARSEDGWVHRVDVLADSAGLSIEAVNAGVSGETSAGGLSRLDWVLRRPLDILVLELGANDGLRGQDPVALEENLTTIVRRTRTRYPGARILIAGMQAPPNLGPRYTGAFAEVFPRVAEETSAELVPFLLEGVAGEPELNQADGIHPTAQGHALMARTVWPHLEPLIREALEESRSEAASTAPDDPS